MINQLTSVEEFTTPNPVTAREDAPIDEVIGLMEDHEVRHVPIVREGQVVGLVSDRDCRLVSGLTREEKRMILAGDIMTTDPVTVSAGESLEEVAMEMSENKIGSVLVNDENDNLLGVFTVTDALNALIELSRVSGEEEF